ncbi:MAG TPA: hypothetical protein DD624_02130 [Alphaproteobacteria bacterium]|nr:hypothetical protein [Alphaproteobacteria bacterium]
MKNLIWTLLFIVTGCATDINDNAYSLSSVGRASAVAQGVIVDVRTVSIQGSNGAGSVLGGVAGGVAASTIGRGAGSVLASVGGALAGAFIGGITQNELTKQQALQYIVRLADGDMINVIQGLNNPLSVGQKVFVLYGKETRLIPDTLPAPKSL